MVREWSGRDVRWLGRETCSSGVGRHRGCSHLGVGVSDARDRNMFGLGSRSVVLEEKLETRWAMEVVCYGKVRREPLWMGFMALDGVHSVVTYCSS